MLPGANQANDKKSRTKKKASEPVASESANASVPESESQVSTMSEAVEDLDDGAMLLQTQTESPGELEETQPLDDDSQMSVAS